MKFDAQEALLPILDPDEKLLWCGIPIQGIYFRSSDALMIPFSLLWGGFAFFWEFTVWSQDATLIFKLWGIPFVLIGIYMTIGRFIYDMWLREDTFYGVTNSRVIIISGIFSRSIKSLNIHQLPEIILTEKENRRGIISFGQDRNFGETNYTAPKFEMIGDVRNVHLLIRNEQKKNK